MNWRENEWMNSYEGDITTLISSYCGQTQSQIMVITVTMVGRDIPILFSKAKIGEPYLLNFFHYEIRENYQLIILIPRCIKNETDL